VNLDEDPNGAAFRREVREWLSANAEVRPPGALRLFESDHDETTVARARHWQAKKFPAGWAGITWPREHGGRGGTVAEQVIWNQEVEAFDAPEDVFMVGIGMAGPTLITHGSQDQQAAFLPPLLRGAEIWCQLFSEPDAGSDLASLKTRAALDGDYYVVNGHKIWTSFAQVADYCELLVRTAPEEKHRGITWLAMPMDLDGIEIRPLPTLLGATEFSEVFLEDVRVPVECRVGVENDGWRVTNVTLSFERGTAFTSDIMKLQEALRELVEVAKRITRDDASAWEDRALRRVPDQVLIALADR